MAVIRPFNPPAVTPQPPAQSPARARGSVEARAAQRAFFQQALGDATPVRAAPVAAQVHAAQPARAAQTAQTVNVMRPIPDEPPARVMRPGSFVDVKV